MALSDVASNLASLAEAGLPHQTCGTCHALAGMSGEEQQVLRGLLGDRGVPFASLEAALAADPDSPNIKRDALSRHARGLCSAGERLRA